MKLLRWCALALLLTSACGGGEDSSDTGARSLLDVLREAGDDNFEPPADGLLTPEQMQMFLAVKRQERDYAIEARKKLEEDVGEAQRASNEGQSVGAALRGLDALRNAGNLVTADLRAAQELGYNTAEYSWVRTAVFQATAEAFTENFQNQNVKALEENLARLRANRSKATNPSRRASYDSQIEALEGALEQNKKDMSARANRPEAVARSANRELIQQYASEIELLQDEIKKYALSSSQ